MGLPLRGRALALGLLFVAPALLAAAPPAQPKPVEVKIENFTFSPATVTLSAGGSVTWINDDDIPHTIAASDYAFKSKVLDTGDRYTQTFAKAGTYSYFCSLHPHMTGKVVVTAH